MLNLPPNPQFCQSDVSGSALVLGDCLIENDKIKDGSANKVIKNIELNLNIRTKNKH